MRGRKDENNAKQMLITKRFKLELQELRYGKSNLNPREEKENTFPSRKVIQHKTTVIK